MKVFLNAAITPNGIIATRSGDTSFVTQNERKNSFAPMIGKSGNYIIGRKTYEAMRRKSEFDDTPQHVPVIVVSRKRVELARKNHFLAKSPKEALQQLKKMGHKKALVAGGGELYASFMKKRLVDEIYLDVEPTLLGQGIPLFSKQSFEATLELVGTKKLSKNEIQLHYKVKKR